MSEDKKTVGKLIVQKIVSQESDYKPEGKTYTLYSWYVDGTFNGEPKSGIQVKTMSAKNKDQVKAGYSCDTCEEQVYRGKLSYFLPAPAFAAGSGGGGGGFSRAPATPYSKEELSALYAWCIGQAAGALGYPTLPDDAASMAVIQSGAATLLIAAQKCGLKVG